MMKMTAKINKKYFDEDDDKDHPANMIAGVTCYSCHNGKEHPETIPPMPPPGPPPASKP